MAYYEEACVIMEEDPLRDVFILLNESINIIIDVSIICMHFEVAVNNQSRNSLLSSQWS